MNKAILMGRLTKDPAVRYTQGEKPMVIARYTLAVNRAIKREREPEADFINCVAFGKAGEFAEKYLRQGMRVVISGRIQTGSYTNTDGRKVYTTDIVVEEQEFAESKASDRGASYIPPAPAPKGGDGFQNIPDGLEEELPFS